MACLNLTTLADKAMELRQRFDDRAQRGKGRYDVRLTPPPYHCPVSDAEAARPCLNNSVERLSVAFY
ncbi:MAG: hypothetical protein K1X42_14675, partial [Opitutaceae bacterium]|nr:hypothetical protein [Opitutaceae bacterium]